MPLRRRLMTEQARNCTSSRTGLREKGRKEERERKRDDNKEKIIKNERKKTITSKEGRKKEKNVRKK